MILKEYIYLQTIQKKSIFVEYLVKLLLHALGLCITVFGVSLTIKANIGNNAWDAFALLLSNILGIKIGYIAMVLNGSTIVGQLLIERRDFQKRQYLQVINVFAAGQIFNLFVYKLLGSFIPIDLCSRIIIATAGCVIAGLGIAIMAETNFVRNSLEGLCDVIAIRVSSTLGKIRRYLDMMIIVSIILITMTWEVPWVIGIGTIISMVVFGVSIDFFRKRIKQR